MAKQRVVYCTLPDPPTELMVGYPPGMTVAALKDAIAEQQSAIAADHMGLRFAAAAAAARRRSSRTARRAWRNLACQTEVRSPCTTRVEEGEEGG